MIKGTPKKLIDWLYDQDKEKVFEIKEYKERRNNDQNAKYWKLLNELALKLGYDTSNWKNVNKKLLLRNCVEPEISEYIYSKLEDQLLKDLGI